jgi:hypothetical protein
MKKIFVFSFLVFLHSQTTYPIFGWHRSTHPDCPFSEVFTSFGTMLKEGKHAVKLYFSNNLDEHWENVPFEKTVYEVKQEKKKQKKLFGYDLGIHYIQDKQDTESLHPTLFFHGWQDTGKSAKLLKRYCKVLPGDIITFNFPDAMPLIAPFWKSSFGQIPDILPALYTLNYVVTKKNLSEIDLYGISRGGATIINMIAVLHDETLFTQYKDDLEKIGITQAERKKLLTVLKNGCIVLDTPLRSMKETMAPPWIVEKFTKYERDGLDPVETAELISDLKLKILVHFQHGDHVVFNSNEGLYFKNLAHKNLKNTYLVVGNDGGHIHTHEALSKTIAMFKKIGQSRLSKESLFTKDAINLIEDESMQLEDGKLFAFNNHECIPHVIEDYHKTHAMRLAQQQRPKNYRHPKTL